MKGRKMDPRPSSTSGSLSFSSGAMDSKSLAKNSSGSLAAVRGLRCVACVDVASMARDGSAASRVVYGGRVSDAGPRFWSGSCWKTWRRTSARATGRAAGAKASTETCGGVGGGARSEQSSLGGGRPVRSALRPTIAPAANSACLSIGLVRRALGRAHRHL